MLRIDVSCVSKHFLMLANFFAAEEVHIWQKWEHIRAFGVQKISKNSNMYLFFVFNFDSCPHCRVSCIYISLLLCSCYHKSILARIFLSIQVFWICLCGSRVFYMNQKIVVSMDWKTLSCKINLHPTSLLLVRPVYPMKQK